MRDLISAHCLTPILGLFICSMTNAGLCRMICVTFAIGWKWNAFTGERRIYFNECFVLATAIISRNYLKVEKCVVRYLCLSCIVAIIMEIHSIY